MNPRSLLRLATLSLLVDITLTNAVNADSTSAVLQRLEKDRQFISSTAPTVRQAEDVMSITRSVSPFLPSGASGSFQSKHPVIDAGAALPYVGGIFATTRFVMIAGSGLASSVRSISAQDDRLNAPIRRALISCDGMLTSRSANDMPKLVSNCRSALVAIQKGQKQYAAESVQVSKLRDLNTKAMGIWRQKNGQSVPQNHPLRALDQALLATGQLLTVRDQLISHERSLFSDVVRLSGQGRRR